MNPDQQFDLIRSGRMYNDLSTELIAAREAAVLLTNDYNATFSRPSAEREAVLRKLLGKEGRNVHFEPTFRCEFGRNIVIGNDFYANFDCVMLDGGGHRRRHPMPGGSRHHRGGSDGFRSHALKATAFAAPLFAAIIRRARGLRVADGGSPCHIPDWGDCGTGRERPMRQEAA